MTKPDGPLAGVRLIEMDAIGPVPLAGMLLSGLGCEIVRVARPGQGAWSDVGASILHRGRLHVELDLKNAADKAKLLDLVELADGLIEGARPGVMERLGLGPEECLARNPALVYGRMTGWGQEGPLALRAGHDINYIAMTGALHAIGERDAPPAVPLNLVGDYGGGTMFLALGMVSAILAARTTGKGQVVDAAMVDGAANLMSLFYAFLSTGQWKDQRHSNLLDGSAPFYRCYTCRDGGHVAVGALEPQFFAILLEGLGINADEFDQNDPRCWPAMEARFTETFASRTRDEWEAVFADRDACVSPVLTMTEAPVHPVNQARGVFVTHDEVIQPAPAPRFSETPTTIRPSVNISIEEAATRWNKQP